MEDELKNIEQEPLKTLEQWELQSALNREHISRPDVEAEWQQVSQRLGLESEDDEQDVREPLIVRLRPLLNWAAGVAAVIAVVLGFRYWTGSIGDVVAVNPSEFAVNVPDSIDEVTLTTIDGKSRDVKQKDIAFDEKKQVVAVGQLMALSTPRGKDYHLTLADGTQVWLNADSRIEFPETFGSERREVRVQGEAYFEVKKDTQRPFIVHTDYFSTRVLGTSFNVRTYNKRDAAVTLVSGRIQVKAGEDTQVLSPGQQATLAGTSLKVQAVDTYPITQWKEGFFYFDNQTLFGIMQELSRWYKVNVSFDDTSKMNVRLHFVAERNKSLNEAVKGLNSMGVADIKIEGNIVVVN